MGLASRLEAEACRAMLLGCAGGGWRGLGRWAVVGMKRNGPQAQKGPKIALRGWINLLKENKKMCDE